jgi:hypothetical protein
MLRSSGIDRNAACGANCVRYLPRSPPCNSAPHGNSGTPTRCRSRPKPITAATAAALGLLGAILGTAGAVIAGTAWMHSGLTATAGGVPPSDLEILLIGLPLAAAIGGWLLAGREPPAIARQPLE